MNHCQPGRELRPLGAKPYRGVVVTPAREGEWMFYVFAGPEHPIFRMPKAIFGSTAADKRTLKKSQLIRRERVLCFGDNIYFTCETQEPVICDYELMESKGHSTITAEDADARLLLHTVGVVSQSTPPRLWTSEFGVIEFQDPREAAEKLCMAAPNVAVNCRIEVTVKDPGYPRPVEMIKQFYDFVGVDPDVRSEVWKAEWNNCAPPAPRMDMSSDEDEDYFVAKEKDTEDELGFWGNRNGLIIGPRSIYCPEEPFLKRQNIVIGLRTEETQIGCRVNVDVYYSDLLDRFVAFRVQVLSDPQFTMYNMRDEQTVKIEIRLSLPNVDGYFFTHPILGLVSDRQGLLCSLPYAESSRKPGDVAVYVAECEISRASRFEIVELPPETIKRVEQAEETMAAKTIKAKGVVGSAQSGLVFVKGKYSCAEFYLQHTEFGRFSVGTVIEFESQYNRARRAHIILTANEALPREPPFACDQIGRFTLNVRFHMTYDLLWHEIFGVIDDPEKMLPRRISRKRPLDVFAHLDIDPKAQTWLVFDEIVDMPTNAGRSANYFFSDDDADDDNAIPKQKEGVHFCQTASVKDRRRRKRREKAFKDRAEGKSVWDPCNQRYEPPKRPASYEPPPAGVSDNESSYGMSNLRI